MPLALEVFYIDPKADHGQAMIDQVTFAREYETAFNDGYHTGFEEAQATMAAQAAHSKTELAQQLQKLSFTYHEAQAHVLTALQPLLRHILDQVLPLIARETLGPIVMETLIPLADRLSDAPLILRVNPASQWAVQTVIEAGTTLPLRLCADPALSEGQVHLQLGLAEAEVNLDQTTADIAIAVRGFFDLHGKDVLYG